MPDLFSDLGHAFREIAPGLPVVGGIFDSIFEGDRRAEERRYQESREDSFVQRRARDARRAGIHPLAALGMNAPSSYGGSMTESGGFERMGQNLDRAVMANSSPNDQYTRRLRQIQLERGELENTLLRSQIANSTGTHFPVDVQPLKPTATGPNPGVTVGEIPEVTWARTSSGGRAPVPSQDVKQSIEDQLIQEIAWALRNNLLPPGGIAGSSGETWVPGFGWIPDSKIPWYLDPFGKLMGKR